MGDSQPKMEVCPYCKKPFKRLKSHLPYCKLRGLASPRDQKGQQLKPAELARGTKVKEPIRDRMKAQRGQSEREKKSTKLLRDKPVQTSETSPVLAVGSEGAGSTNTPDKDSKNQVQLSAKMLNTEPETSRHGETNSRLYAPESTSAEKELSRNVCPSDNSSCSHPGTAASLVIGSLEPSLSTQGGMYPSAPPHDVHTASSDLKLDTADPQRQGLLATLLDVPPGDYHSSPRNLSDGAEGPKYPCQATQEMPWEGLAPRESLLVLETPRLGTRTQSPSFQALQLTRWGQPTGNGMKEKDFTLKERQVGAKEMPRKAFQPEKFQSRLPLA